MVRGEAGLTRKKNNLWSQEYATSFPCEKSVQNLNWVTDWILPCPQGISNITMALWSSCFCRVERPRSPLGRTKESRESRNLRCLFAKTFWNMHTRSVLRILFSLLCVKYISFGVMEAFDSKGIINTLKRYCVSRGMRWRCEFHFRYDMILGAFHSTKNSGNSGWRANGKDIFRNIISEF